MRVRGLRRCIGCCFAECGSGPRCDVCDVTRVSPYYSFESENVSLDLVWHNPSKNIQ